MDRSVGEKIKIEKKMYLFNLEKHDAFPHQDLVLYQ